MKKCDRFQSVASRCRARDARRRIIAQPAAGLATVPKFIGTHFNLVLQCRTAKLSISKKKKNDFVSSLPHNSCVASCIVRRRGAFYTGRKSSDRHNILLFSPQPFVEYSWQCRCTKHIVLYDRCGCTACTTSLAIKLWKRGVCIRARII